MDSKKIGVIIITYNNICNTLYAIESVLNSDYKNIDIVIVDNASFPVYREKLLNACTERFPSVTVLYLEKENGYGAACNFGTRYVIGRGADALLILNNDIALHKNCISQLMMNLDENVTLSGPKVYSGFSDIIASSGGHINKKFMIVKNRGAGEVDMGRYDKKEKVDFITGCAFLISVKAFRELNGFDEQFYYYAEESDLCYRLVKAGYSIIYEPKAVAYHWVSTTFGNESKKSIYYLIRSNLQFAYKHTKGNRIIFFNHCLYLFYEYIVMLILRRLAYIITRIIVTIRAVKDFIMHKTGKCL